MNAERFFFSGNYFDKYRSPNPIHQLLVRQYLRRAKSFLAGLDFKDVLEVGCGPGDLAVLLFQKTEPPVSYVGLDISEEQVAIAKQRYPKFSFASASIYSIPSQFRPRDLVIACEVLEHLESPGLALAQLVDATNRWLLISVPSEPLWRILNTLRGRYWRHLGNTPGHLQHFSRRKIVNLVQSRIGVVKQAAPFPWTMILAQK